MTRIKPFPALSLVWAVSVIFTGHIAIHGISIVHVTLYGLLIAAFSFRILKREEISRMIQSIIIFAMALWIYLLAGTMMKLFPLTPVDVVNNKYPTALLLTYSAWEMFIPTLIMSPLIFLGFSKTTQVTFFVSIPTIVMLSSFNGLNFYSIGLSIEVIFVKIFAVSLVALFLAIIRGQDGRKGDEVSIPSRF